MRALLPFLLPVLGSLYGTVRPKRKSKQRKAKSEQQEACQDCHQLAALDLKLLTWALVP